MRLSITTAPEFAQRPSANHESDACCSLPMNLAPTNPPPAPPRRGTRQSVLLPSWEGLGVGSGAQCGRKIMKTKQLLVSLAALCAIATVVGCASIDRQASQSSFDVMNLNRDRKPSSAEFSQLLNLNQRAFQKPDLDTNGAVTLDEWQRFDTNAGPKENFSMLDANVDAQINAKEFLTPTPKHAKRYHFFADPEKTNQDYSSRGQEEFQPQGLQLFSIRF